MIKQLLLFPFAALFVVVCVVLVIRETSLRQKIAEFFVVFFGFLSAIFLVDSLFQFDSQFISHLHRVLHVYGSERHLHEISANGFNIWMALGPDFVDATQPFWRNFTPKTVGFVFFTLYTFALTGFTVYKILAHKSQFSKTHIFACLLCFFALFNLAFNLLLTGTHDRYLLYFYPYIILASLLLKHKTCFYLVFIMAFVYGFFVLVILNRNFELLFHYITGVPHFTFFVYLTVLLFVQLSPSKNAK